MKIILFIFTFIPFFSSAQDRALCEKIISQELARNKLGTLYLPTITKKEKEHIPNSRVFTSNRALITRNFKNTSSKTEKEALALQLINLKEQFNFSSIKNAILEDGGHFSKSWIFGEKSNNNAEVFFDEETNTIPGFSIHSDDGISFFHFDDRCSVTHIRQWYSDHQYTKNSVKFFESHLKPKYEINKKTCKNKFWANSTKNFKEEQKYLCTAFFKTQKRAPTAIAEKNLPIQKTTAVK